jgi:hypothetical protein
MPPSFATSRREHIVDFVYEPNDSSRSGQDARAVPIRQYRPLPRCDRGHIRQAHRGRVTDDMARVHRGDSAVQRAAEAEMLELLAAKLGVRFEAGKRVMPDGTRVELEIEPDLP